MSYNLSYVANSSGMVQFMQRINSELMKGYFGVSILLTFAAISFIAFMTATNNRGKSFIGAAMISFVMCMFLRALELVPNFAFYVCLIIAALSVGFAKLD